MMSIGGRQQGSEELFKATWGDRLLHILGLAFLPLSLALMGLYRLLVGWWADPRLTRESERQFAEDIRQHLPFLFTEYGGQIVPNRGVRFPPGFDYAFVTIAFGRSLLRFGRGRGEFRVDIAPRWAADDWQDWKNAEDVLRVVDRSEDSELPPMRNLNQAEQVLRVELPRLQEATSNEQWDLVKRKVNALRPPLIRIR
jgi:hypothetical protein